MATLFDMSFAVTIGGFLYKFMSEAINYVLANRIYDEKIQLSLLYQTIFGMGIICIIYFLGKKNIIISKGIRYGLILGAILLICEAIILNWSKLDDKTRIILLGCGLILVLTITYFS